MDKILVEFYDDEGNIIGKKYYANINRTIEAYEMYMNNIVASYEIKIIKGRGIH